MSPASPPEPAALVTLLGIRHQNHAPLGPLNWYGTGGCAETLAFPEDTTQLSTLLAACSQAGVPCRILGKGANLLVAAERVPGVVIKLDSPFFRRTEIDPVTGRVLAGGGSDLEQLVTATVRASLAGLEGLAGIPATVGGALCMNAGGAFGEIGPLVRRVRVLTPDGRVQDWGPGEYEYGYRRSNLKGLCVAEAEFALTPHPDQPALRAKLKEVMQYKKQRQPMAARSAGCAFKNPSPDRSQKGAGRLIDEAGLKGFRIGGAEISPVHANFIVLHEGGTAADVLAVMRHAAETVERQFGIRLETEQVIWE